MGDDDARIDHDVFFPPWLAAAGIAEYGSRCTCFGSASAEGLPAGRLWVWTGAAGFDGGAALVDFVIGSFLSGVTDDQFVLVDYGILLKVRTKTPIKSIELRIVITVRITDYMESFCNVSMISTL
jgi:hypothetical protein